MSLLLKGVDLPGKGETLILKIKDSRIYREYPRYKFQPTRIKDAEAIQIPEDHGRIIDAKILKDTIKDSIPTYTAGVKIPTYGDLDLMDKIDMMPTILEAEGNA